MAEPKCVFNREAGWPSQRACFREAGWLSQSACFREIGWPSQSACFREAGWPSQGTTEGGLWPTRELSYIYTVISITMLPQDACARAWRRARAGRPAERPGRSARPPWPLRVARIAPSRTASLDRAAPIAKSRSNQAPERPRDAIFRDVGSIFESIFEVFRGCVARATRRAVRIAEPLFLPTGAVLRTGRALRALTEN